MKKRLLSLLLSCTLFLTSCAGLSIPTNVNTSFENFTREIFLQDVASTTLGLHYTLQSPEDYGIKDTPITFGAFSTEPSAILASTENQKAFLERFPYYSLSDENQLTYDVFSSYLNTTLAGASYILYEEPLSPLTGIHAQLPVLLAEYAFYSSDDIETYLKLLASTPDYFDSLISFEKEKSKAGLFMADYAVDSVLEQCEAFISMGEHNYLLSTFEDRLQEVPHLSNTQKADYLAQNKTTVFSDVIPSYEKLITALSDLKGTGKNELGLCYFSGGRDYYSHLTLRETGSSRSMDEIQTLMEQQISSDILNLQDTLSKNPNIITTSAELPVSSPNVLLDTLQTKIKAAFPTGPQVNIDIKYVPAALEEYLSPAFYFIPAIDNFTENVIYINPSHKMENVNLFTTLAHEGYPGHLYQTTYYASKNPDPLRTIFNFKGYVEGWATYAEMCSYYLCPIEKSMATLLQKNNSLILGLYAMADVGIHYHGWNLERTISFFQTYGIENEATVQEIYELIVCDPANYLSYYVGYLEILELKKEMMKKEGEDFSQKGFHKQLLDIGPAPFDVVRKHLGLR